MGKLAIVKNIVAVVVLGFLAMEAINSNPGYNWAYNSLLKGNLKMIKEHPNLTLEQKYEMKVGFSYRYLNYVKAQTPKDAVILLPAQSDFFPKDEKSPFSGEPYNKLWSTRFLYPRKLVLPNELDKNRYASQITHVAIVNDRGYERLNFTVEEPVGHAIIPVNTK